MHAIVFNITELPIFTQIRIFWNIIKSRTSVDDNFTHQV